MAMTKGMLFDSYEIFGSPYYNVTFGNPWIYATSTYPNALTHVLNNGWELRMEVDWGIIGCRLTPQYG